MDFPWKESATLVRMPAERMGDHSNEILFEGPLLDLAKKARAMTKSERRFLKISLPDRRTRPHTFKDDALAALIEGIPRPV